MATPHHLPKKRDALKGIQISFLRVPNGNFPGFSLVLQAYKNHLMAIGPRLEGKTLHMRASFLELMTILWLKWLTCSTGSVLLLLNSEGWLSKLTRELCVLNVTRRWWSRYLAQGPTHGISPHIPQRRCSIPPMKGVFLPFQRERAPHEHCFAGF